MFVFFPQTRLWIALWSLRESLYFFFAVHANLTAALRDLIGQRNVCMSNRFRKKNPQERFART
jgi:hypothetical protein